MQAPCHVRLTPGGPLVPAVLTTERSESSYGQPVVHVPSDPSNVAYGPAEVAEVRIDADCPRELLDAAVGAGYYVLGQPR